MVLSMYSAGEGVSDLKIHVSAIATFLRRHEWLWGAHVVDFFHVKLWERVDEHWNSSLRVVSAETLLLLPSGVIQEEWPDALKEFVQTAFQLSLSRGQVDISLNMSYSGVPQAPISIVLGQGMSAKKLHEIGILAALIAGTAKSTGAKDVIDVGAGQGYLALVLAFEYRLSVIAVDACAHHADVTNKRALRIQKYYNARSRKSQQEGLKFPEARAPHTVTCRVGTGESPAALSSLLPAIQESNSSEAHFVKDRIADHDEQPVSELKDRGVALAGLHACGDLSATMLRTFIECKEVAAVINVGCCYNLLSDVETSNDRKELYGFPMSDTVSKLGLQLGRSARDLACQSADRWKEHHPTRAIQNFELHAFRAAFQLVLERYYPETAINNPSVGRLGKSRRRRQARQSAMEPLFDNTSNDALQAKTNDDLLDVTCISASSTQALEDPPITCGPSNICNLDKPSRPEQEETFPILDFEANSLEQQAARFEEYARLALERLHLLPVPASLLKSVWREVAPCQDLVGPFYSLRAVLAPVIESYILLDRLLYLKEQAELVAGKERITAELVPLFDPSISPRNMAIIAHRGSRLENRTANNSMRVNKDIAQHLYAGASFHMIRNYYISPVNHDDVLVYWSSSRCVDERQRIATELLGFLPHHSFGKCLNNMGGLNMVFDKYPNCNKVSGAGKAWNQNLHCAMSYYKFVLAIENTISESYVTEKLYYALDAGREMILVRINGTKLPQLWDRLLSQEFISWHTLEYQLEVPEVLECQPELPQVLSKIFIIFH